MEYSQHTSAGARITQTGSGWRLEIPPGNFSQYRLSQLDDYSNLRRREMVWQSPTTLSLRARVSSRIIPGTWGFGFWNDPFSTLMGLGGMARPLPALPNAAWFFFGSQENYLSFRNDKPSNGFLAASFRSHQIPALFLSPALFLLPMLLFKKSARWLRYLIGRHIKEDSASLEIDVTKWHEYKLRWETNQVSFDVDGSTRFVTNKSPQVPLGLVIWIDNQFAAFMPSGKIKAGTLDNPVPAWMEIENISIR